VDAARRALESLAAPLGISVEECAEGMIRIATEAMAQSVKIVLASRGRDPRDYALASFGGAGPMHAGAVAAALSIPKVIVPRYSGVASAFGATRLKLKHDEEMFHFAKLNAASLADIAGRFERLESRAVEALLEQGASKHELSSSHIMRMRYAGQTFEVDVPQDAATIASGNLEAVTEAFHRTHALEFGVRSDDFPIEVVALAVTVEGRAAGATGGAGTSGAPPKSKAAHARRKVFFGGAWHDADVHESESLAAGADVAGPAIIEDPHTCIVVPPGWVSRKDKHQNFILEVRHDKQ
jgi:N-methylhydantoinase A